MVPSLTDVFGPGASQTATTVTVAKTDFPTLTPTSDNNGQELFVGIILQAIKKLNPTARGTDPDIKIEITYTGQAVYPGPDKNDRQDSYTIVLHKDVPQEMVDADDY
jgi:hypothetical protein